MKPCGIELFQRPLYLIFAQFGNAVSTLFFKMHPPNQKSAKSQTIVFSIVFPFDTPFSAFFDFSAGFKAGYGSNRFPIARFPRI